jgi:hypothetical protein
MCPSSLLAQAKVLVSIMKTLAIFFQVVCIIVNFFGAVVGALQHHALLLVWCIFWGGYSSYVLENLLQEEE